MGQLVPGLGKYSGAVHVVRAGRAVEKSYCYSCCHSDDCLCAVVGQIDASVVGWFRIGWDRRILVALRPY